jgi:hypothetical protein
VIPFHIPTPQGCNIQTFYGLATAASSTESRNWRAWNKPVGVSHIYMMLIGGGGDGDATNGGGSGAVTVWYGAAQHVPDVLQVYASAPSGSASATEVAYLSSTAGFVALLTANSSTGTGAAAAMTANYFTASGFFQSTAGQAGPAGNVSPSATTFLSAGAGGSTAGTITANYGYTANLTGASGSGYFQLQPIIVGVGSAGPRPSAVGCGSGISGTFGGQGMVLIASW